MIVDAHHHFWRYDPREYGWISDRMPALRRDFMPEDLRLEMTAAGVDGVVSVQARQSIAETNWLLELAEANPFIKGVVGWVPLTSPGAEHDLGRFAANKKLKAVRHVVQDEPNDQYILREDFNRGVGFIKDFGLVYDILIFEKHLPQTIQFVDRHPEQRFVLDHLAKPAVRGGAVSPWQENLGELAKRPNVYCKLSGVATEADWESWTPEQLMPYVDAAMDAFTPRRMMFGSDWPVCLLATGYQQWFRFVAGIAAKLSASERARLMGDTAVEAYNLTDLERTT